MSVFDLLSAVQPTGGWYAIIGIPTNGKPIQILVDTREAADEEIAKYLAKGLNVFFGVAKFATDHNRLKDNVLALRALWLDLDCGPDKAAPDPKTGKIKGYPDQASALSALKEFCSVHGLPKPIIVNSGRGLHVYWPLDRDVTREEWEPVAAKLRDLCNTHGLIVDPSVFEVARVLRVPGTKNFKQNPPLDVTVLVEAPPTPWGVLCAALSITPPPSTTPPARRRGLTALGLAMQANIENSFAKIVERTKAGDGCEQIKLCIIERATLPEPRWFDALSIAKFCVDKDDAIEAVSYGYPGYTLHGATSKAEHISGPHSCKVFAINNPGVCGGCPHYNKITSPILLGKEIKQAVTDHIIQVDPDGTINVYAVPEYPFPYFRGTEGGVYRRHSEDEQDDELVCPHDLYVVKRRHDHDLGFVNVMRIHLPKDGVIDFKIPQGDVGGDPKAIRHTLASWGVPWSSEKEFQRVLHYVRRSIENLKYARKADTVRLQFGWADNDSKFIVGDREISVEGTFHAAPSPVISAIAAHIGPCGTMEKWKEVFNLYGREGLEAHAFAAATAFGAPLLRFLGHNGAIINCLHPQSGTGKTTILHMCNSVWGSPSRLCAVKEDTMNAKIMRLGVMNNLPFTVDELTNATALEFSTLAYNMSQGRGKDRVKQSANELRANLTSWQTISLCSSNASFYEKMAVEKTSADGEMMRLLEFSINFTDVLDVEFAKQMFDHQLQRNYGHAGEIYARYLVENMEEVRDLVLSIQMKLDRELQLTQRERFWSAVAAANITGGIIAHKLGLINWDMKRIYKWVCALIREMRKGVAPPRLDPAATLGDFINRNMQGALVVNDTLDARTKMQAAPVVTPRGNELVIRYEPDTKNMYIPVTAFRAYCAKFQINLSTTLEGLEKAGVLVNRRFKKRMNKGSLLKGLSVDCLVFDCTNSEFLDVAAVVLPPTPPTPVTNDVSGAR